MSTNRILGAGSAVGLIALIAFGIFAVSGGLGGSEGNAKTADTAREAACLEGSEDCDDTFDQPIDGGDGVAGICLAPEEGVTSDEDKPCVDTPGTGGGFEQTCPVDMPECMDGCSVSSDGVVDCGGGSDGFGGGSSSPGYPGCGTPEECQRVAVEAAWTLLEGDGVSGEITLLGAKSVEWPNSCLGVTSADIACAEVITPGFVVTLQRNGQEFVFNTDTAGNAVAAQ